MIGTSQREMLRIFSLHMTIHCSRIRHKSNPTVFRQLGIYDGYVSSYGKTCATCVRSEGYAPSQRCSRKPNFPSVWNYAIRWPWLAHCCVFRTAPVHSNCCKMYGLSWRQPSQPRSQFGSSLIHKNHTHLKWASLLSRQGQGYVC